MVSQKCEQNYIKHPQNIPIWVTTLTATNDRPTVASLKKAQKYGGLVFRHTKPLTPGTHVEITIRITQPVFRAKGIVSWCRARKGKWEIAAQFINTSDAFRIRMIEQVCHIEQYKRDVAREEGRYLSTEKAAHEWIKKYASQFPNPFAPFYTYK